MRKDLTFIVDDWEYNPDDVTVRSILGTDGREKIQMRLDLGVLQMEPNGRPDGKRPYGQESLLEYYQEQLQLHTELYGNDTEFVLNSDACALLRQESMQYYYRYLSLFHLARFDEVLRDAERNLRLYNFVHRYGNTEEDRAVLEQFRPYVLMMRARARACALLEEKNFNEAVKEVDDGIEEIRKHWTLMHRSDQLDNCREISFLHEWR
ncbi:MAG: hypothetical protein ABI210_03960, partial [Abditibacteriaceae bacterium]